MRVRLVLEHKGFVCLASWSIFGLLRDSVCQRNPEVLCWFQQRLISVLAHFDSSHDPLVLRDWPSFPTLIHLYSLSHSFFFPPGWVLFETFLFSLSSPLEVPCSVPFMKKAFRRQTNNVRKRSINLLTWLDGGQLINWWHRTR